MASILDVAAYILKKQGTMTTMKLQKLAFYSQAEYLREFKEPLFDSSFQAWINGPVSVELFRHHRGLFLIRPQDLTGATPSALKLEERKTVDLVLSVYGEKSGKELSILTHQEAPWKDAREGLATDQAGNVEITNDAILDYYSKHPLVR
ncbi:Panacea domain-containing protein [Alloscardovia venturai]|uniref:Panacea domain-containing protein n=1 Tax=Alloscardovia venturai TaxID=1769421 RepID=A0ABW2Y6K2_9BIFI